MCMCSHVVTVTSVVYWYWKEFQELSLYLIYWIGGLVLKGCPGKVQVNREQLHPVEQLEGQRYCTILVLTVVNVVVTL